MRARLQMHCRAIGIGLSLWLCLLLAGCSNAPERQHIPTTSPVRHRIALIALQQVGDGYQVNLTGPRAYDASGLVYYAYHQAGAELPRTLNDQLDTGKPITLSRAQPADLAFFQVDGRDGWPQTTVGLLISKQRMVIAIPGTGSRQGVRLVKLGDGYWKQRLIGVARVLP